MVWADDFSAAEKNLGRWRDLLTDIVPNFGYSPENSKTWSYGLKKNGLVVQSNSWEKANIWFREKREKKSWSDLHLHRSMVYAVEREGKIKLQHEINREKLQINRSQLDNTASNTENL